MIGYSLYGKYRIDFKRRQYISSRSFSELIQGEWNEENVFTAIRNPAVSVVPREATFLALDPGEEIKCEILRSWRQ